MVLMIGVVFSGMRSRLWRLEAVKGGCVSFLMSDLFERLSSKKKNLEHKENNQRN